MNLATLPEDCFAEILSLTSPIDACRISVVSSAIRVSVNSDKVWERFLPSDYEDILSRLLHPLVYSCKKELYLRLCIPHLIDGGTKTFSLEKSSGKKIYLLSARELNITWAENPLFWTWKSFPASRFVEVAELRTIWWLEIQGRINSQMLSPKIKYGAYLIVKFVDRAYGLDILPSKVSVEVGNLKISEGTICLGQHQNKTAIWFSNQIEALSELRSSSRPASNFRSGIIHNVNEERVPCTREDGWIEIELGSFYNHGTNVEVKMCLKEVTGTHLKGGLVVEGIELRPKQS